MFLLGGILEADPALIKQLSELYKAKLTSPAYQDWKQVNHRTMEGQSFEEERQIKKVISQMTKQVNVPEGKPVSVIPIKTSNFPNVDGKIQEGEWEGALEIDIGYGDVYTPIYLLSDSKRLYVAADVIQGKTRKTSFFFKYHIDLTPFLRREQVNLYPGSTQLQSSRLVYQKEFGISFYWNYDSHIYRNARGAGSRASGHQQYELVIDLSEANIHRDVPFSSFIQIGTDSKKMVLSNGREYQKPMFLGLLGSNIRPHWFVISDSYISDPNNVVAKEVIEHPHISKINPGRKVIDYEKYVVKGAYTIFYFYTDWCKPCHVLGPRLENLAKSREDVYVRKIDCDVIDSPENMANDIAGYPTVTIFGKNGQILHDKVIYLEPIEKILDEMF